MNCCFCFSFSFSKIYGPLKFQFSALPAALAHYFTIHGAGRPIGIISNLITAFMSWGSTKQNKHLQCTCQELVLGMILSHSIQQSGPFFVSQMLSTGTNLTQKSLLTQVSQRQAIKWISRSISFFQMFYSRNHNIFCEITLLGSEYPIHSTYTICISRHIYCSHDWISTE